MLPANILLVQQIEQRGAVRRENIRRRQLRDTNDPFTLPNRRFVELFRLNKDMVHYLVNTLTPHLKQMKRTSEVHPTLKIFCALRFYATGEYQRSLGTSRLHAMSQQTISKCIKEVSQGIYENLSNYWIQFPQTAREKALIKEVFMQRTRFPGVIGCIDCTHISIIAPREEEHNYLNRKGYHSKNVQIICDYNLRILNINARHAGATHDVYIWRLSTVQRELQNCYRNGDTNTWLLGDSGYPQQPWLMTPVQNAVVNSPEERYNQRHTSARNCIERCNGVLKSRFRCLSGERQLRYNPQYVGIITTVCAVLHNICIAGGEPWEEEISHDEPGRDNCIHDNQGPDILNAGRAIRNRIIQQYFR